MDYTVKLTNSEDNNRAIARADGNTIETSIVSGDTTHGFNAVQTLLTAMGTCLMTNLRSISKKMGIELEEVRLEITGTRIQEPPMLTKILLVVHLKTNAPRKKIDRLLSLSVKYGTVLNTVLKGIEPEIFVTTSQNLKYSIPFSYAHDRTNTHLHR